MIRLVNLTKRYNDKLVLKNISLSLDRYGFVALVGPSGCGKSTLLNCLSNLIDYDGDIFIDDVNIRKVKNIDDFRLKNIGFVFQDFKLYESESVERNVLFPLDISSNATKTRKLRKCQDLLGVVGLENMSKKKVNTLSGGQKQRVAIARALANDPKIILADEPTGALDSENAESIMKLLSHISKKSLVMMVSHDRKLAQKYVDRIIELKDGSIKEVKFTNGNEHDVFLPVCKNKITSKKPSLPIPFVSLHTLNSLKTKKWRTLICTFITSLGLIGIGSSVTLTQQIKDNIKNSYSSIVDENTISVSVKNNSITNYSLYSASLEDAIEIEEKYNQEVKGVGVYYNVDFESFFKDCNNFNLINSSQQFTLSSISARSINEYKWLDEPHPTIYPVGHEEIQNDEIILSLTMKDVEDICWYLKIPRTVNSLSDYISKNKLAFYFDFANYDWQYTDQQLLTVVGFTLEKTTGIYHSNHLWNQYMFEDQMRFPSDQNISFGSYPWLMQKIPYLNIPFEKENFINKTKKSKEESDYIFELANDTTYPWLYRNTVPIERNRFFVFFNYNDSIPLSYLDYFYKASPYISDPIFGCTNSYSIYPSSLMIGFSNITYFSFNQEITDEVIDMNTNLNLENNEIQNLPKGIIDGYFAKTQQNSVKFQNILSKVDDGRLPENEEEIVISSSMAKELLGNENCINKKLLMTYMINKKVLKNGKTMKEFLTCDMKVVGIIKNENFLIYQNPFWIISFFQTHFGISAFDLLVNTINFKVDDIQNMDSTMTSLKRAFPNFEILNPMEGINDSINEVCNWVEIALSIFSFISVLISVMLLSICNYLHIVENGKDIALARCIGVSKNQTKAFVYLHSFILCGFSFLASCFELLFISVFINLLIGNSLNISTAFSINPLGFIYMFILALAISCISSVFISNKVLSLNPLKVLKGEFS